MTGLAELLQIPQKTEFLLNLSQDAARKWLEKANEPSIIDGTALVDHHLTILPISCDSARQGDAEKVPSDAAGRAREDPGGWMSRFVEQVGLDHQNRSYLPRLGSQMRAKIGEVQRSSPDSHCSSRFSDARWSSCASSSVSDARVACDARR